MLQGGVDVIVLNIELLDVEGVIDVCNTCLLSFASIVMVAFAGPLATIHCELRQAWKGATVTVDSGAGVWLALAASIFMSFTVFLPQIPPNTYLIQ